MSATPSATSQDGGQTSTFPVLYVILGGAALLSAVVFPIAFIFAARYFRRLSRSDEQQLLGPPTVITREKLQQEKPKLFDVYVKPGLEVHQATFESILPLAVRAATTRHAPPATDALSTPPSVLRAHYQLRSRDRRAYKAEAPTDEDTLIYDLGVLIAMPRPHTVDHWNELGEYAIGKLVIPAPLDSSVPP